MQGKGMIKFFLVVLTLVCLLQYFYILPTAKVERNAAEHANRVTAGIDNPEERKKAESEAQSAYLDSMSSEVVFSIPLLKSWTYEELKAAQLGLGLDLKGGMSVVLQVDLRDFIRSLANDSKDPTFLKALENASTAQANAQSDYVTLFADEYKKLTPDGKLAKLFARNASMKDDINFETTNSEVIALIRQRANETVSLTHKRLKDRIDELGVVQPNVSLDAARDLILVELPGISNAERARKFLQTTAKLEFWEVFRVIDPGIVNGFIEADAKLKRTAAGETEDLVEDTPNFRIDTTYNYQYDSLGNPVDSTMVIDSVDMNQFNDPIADGGPLLSRLNLNATTGGQLTMSPAVMGTAEKNQIDQINRYLAQDNIKALFPKNVKFLWSQKAETYGEGDDAENLYELYAIRQSKGNSKAPLEGDVITNASANPDPTTGDITVSLNMNGQGAKKWGQMTTQMAQDNNREIAIVLDDRVVSAPRVNQPILTGSSSIAGGFSQVEAEDLAKILEIGKLPARTDIIQESIVGPTLGAENIARSINSLLIGYALLVAFMIFYYGSGGIVSIIALLMNLFFIGGALASFGTVLTLPGIAGIVLTIGMAVDANVIIYERIREELRAGKSLLASIKDGFQHSYSAIIDANVTTILTAMVLAYFGLGPIKGFAVVLIIGVLSSLFTAVLVGRLMIEWWTQGRGNNISFWTPTSKNLFADMNIDWLGKRKVAYGISLAVIVLGGISFMVRSFEYGIDFKGGYSYNIQFDQGANVDAEQLRQILATEFEGAGTIVKEVSTANTFNVTTSYLIDNLDEESDAMVMSKLFNGINQVAGGNLTIDNFKNPDGLGTHVTSSSKVGPSIADDIKVSSVYATVFALLLIFLYIFIRFSKWQYSLGAVAALFHDTWIVLAIFSLGHGILPFSMEIDQAFIAAILTVIGYSINDTVVVFDRIREFMNNYTNQSKEQIINAAINSTVSRTVITSFTTLLVVGILLFFGGTSIRGFAFAIFIGVIVGTYSSIFVATPIMSDLSGDLQPKQAKKKSFSRASTR
ncbi:MAG: protein translocase subunit SecDF [Bacteroidota bacterium]